ncbi:MAG: 50S ribosomal protein L3 [Candidatus Bathyarchaeia archaeon]|nr:50S ribosomal protein L3 [Candidatus Bathyarchaeota archaeon]
MAMKHHAPKHGSLAYLPRKRAKSIVARIRYWPEVKADNPRLLGFMAYKAGMTYAVIIETKKRSPYFGREVIRPVTVLDAPPILICAIRAYIKTTDGLKTFTEAWMDNPPKDLERVLTLPDKFNTEDGLKKIEENIDKIAKIRVLAITQPRLTSVPKKKPDVAEIEIGGGTIQQQFEYAKSILGKTISPSDVFSEGQYVDVVAVTTGKGFEGPVKRWGIKIKQHKSRKTKRGVGTLGPWKPSRVLYSVPRAGQMGFHQRTEYNKRILKIGVDGKEVTPKGGFIRYGLVRGPYILIEGSVPGPEKRLIKLRYPARPPKEVAEAAPQIVSISLESPQGK